MHLKQFFFVVPVLALFVLSCVSTKRLTYLQENEGASESVGRVERIQKPYRIQVDDLLSVRVKALDQELVGMFNPLVMEKTAAGPEEALYFNGFLVDVRGNIRIPTLGEVHVLGLTVEEIRKKVERELLEHYFTEEANLFVSVKLAGIRYTTIGEIGSGSQLIFKEKVTVMEAIANAGDITKYGDRTNVVILRQYPGGERRHHIDLTDINAVKSPFYYIQPNDLIIVNPLPQKSLGLGTTGLETFRTLTMVLTFLTTTVLLFTRL